MSEITVPLVSQKMQLAEFINLKGGSRDAMPPSSAQFKEQAVRRLMPPNSQTISTVSQDLGVSTHKNHNGHLPVKSAVTFREIRTWTTKD